MPPSGRKRRDRGVQFIRSNLELLGFGSRRDALVQAVKELFENALDATQSLGDCDVVWADAPLELLRVRVALNKERETIDIVQLHASDACLKVATTSQSDGILYVQLRIDADSEETAVVKQVMQFVVNEEHQHFSGTEVRLSVPCPEQMMDLQSAAETLAMYFQSLRYTAPPFLGVQFDFSVGEVSRSITCEHREEPIDRFAADVGASADDVVYAVHDWESVSISCVALMLGDVQVGGTEPDMEISLLRFANHAPLINGEDFFLCGITKGVCTAKLWKKFGLRCQRNSSKLANQLIATPLRATMQREDADKSRSNRLVVAVDICIADTAVGEGIKYGSLRKSTLDACYADGVRTCCQSILQQLADDGRLCSPQQRQDHDLVENLAPLIAKSLTTIATQFNVQQSVDKASSQLERDWQGQCNEGLILQELRSALQNR
ncbi:unnamed protein product [Hyaloperonospora brassicae]|uniref:Uncharacterized protein n=1 Tax=Hyaloperonospora brassicae TaxID=162125 RepID=A0AAV0UN50_HYABA|nr:unnamed protein product [Hyaloperonospora brassicae]